MSSEELLASLKSEVENDVSVMGSATTLINGFAARLEAAVAAALQNGATQEQLAPIQGEIDILRAGSSDLAAAVAANTVSA